MRQTIPPASTEDVTALPPINFDPVMKFESAPVQAAFDYWDRLRAGRIMPARSQINRKEMRGFAENVGLVEVKSDAFGAAKYFVAFAGKKIEAIFGARSGRTLDEGVPDAIAARWRLAYDMVQRSAKPIKATAHIAFEGKTQIETEILVAPLGDDATPTSFFVAITALT